MQQALGTGGKGAGVLTGKEGELASIACHSVRDSRPHIYIINVTASVTAVRTQG